MPQRTQRQPKQAIKNLPEQFNASRVSQHLVNDRIAETVKSIRNLYDIRQKKRNRRSGMKPGLLF